VIHNSRIVGRVVFYAETTIPANGHYDQPSYHRGHETEIMANFLRLALWNANGLIQHAEELKTFISLHNTDVMLISETHFTEKCYLKLLNYTVYHTNHPAGTARGGTAIIIQNSIHHHQLNGYCFDFLQATTVSVEESVGSLIISAVYLPPKHTVKQEQLETFYNTLGQRFIAGGDYYDKHTAWGSRIITPRGREIYKTMEHYTYAISPRANPLTGPLTEINCPTFWTFVSQRVFPKLRYSNVLSRPIIRPLSGHSCTHNTCPPPASPDTS
jgi:hypothetical protein